MRVVIQRVSRASVLVSKKEVSKINKGLLVLLAIHKDDEEGSIYKMADKILSLRIFEDKNSKMNLSLRDLEAQILVVPQFTLYGDAKKGNRPSFTDSASPKKALEFYNKMIDYISKKNIQIKTGEFQKHMKVQLENDGPVSIILDL